MLAAIHDANRLARVLIGEHGTQAIVFALARARLLLMAGDNSGAMHWCEVAAEILRLQPVPRLHNKAA